MQSSGPQNAIGLALAVSGQPGSSPTRRPGNAVNVRFPQGQEAFARDRRFGLLVSWCTGRA